MLELKPRHLIASILFVGSIVMASLRIDSSSAMFFWSAVVALVFMN